MLEIESTIVRLGAKDFEIQQAGFRRSKPWKKRLLTEIKPLFEQVTGAKDITFDAPEDLLQLLPVVESLFVEGIETILDLLVAYSAELEAERDYIEEHATDKQIFAAFQEVLKLMDFFGAIPMLNKQFGRMGTGTSQNLQSANGDSDPTKSSDLPTDTLTS